MKSVMYKDDILQIAQSPEILKQHTLTTLDLLEALGHLVNYPKSKLAHTQSTIFLGLVVNCKTGELSFPISKVKTIQKEARLLLTQALITPCQLTQFNGKLSAAILAVHQPHCTTGDEMEWTYEAVINTTQGQPAASSIYMFLSPSSKNYVSSPRHPCRFYSCF